MEKKNEINQSIISARSLSLVLTLSSSPTSILRSASTAGASTFAGAAIATLARPPSAAAALAVDAFASDDSAA